nr:2-phosphosulfolactate phosphatase [Cellulomonas sp. JH27-2]
MLGQGSHAVRLDWGLTGAVAAGADVSVIVDVLSFSTTVTVAVGRGTRVYPSPWAGERAQALALRHGAKLAVGRLEATRGSVVAPSLSPATFLTRDPVERLVLPSPNGSAIAAALSEERSRVVVGCLRNARAVAVHIGHALDRGASVGVIAAGERWSEDGTLRPALEDHLGAGAILSHLAALGHGHRFSPEAESAATLFGASLGALDRLIHGCVGGRELTAMRFGDDVAIAAALDSTATVPVLRDGAFVDAGEASHG